MPSYFVIQSKMYISHLLKQAHSMNVYLLLLILRGFFGCDIALVGSIFPQGCSRLSR